MIKEEIYRVLIENLHVGIIALNNDWDILYANDNAAYMLERRTASLIGKNLWKEFPQAVDGPFYKAYHQALQTQQTIYVENYSTRLDKWIGAAVYPSSFGLSVYFHDVTGQRKAELQVKESEEKHRILIDRITDGFIALDKNFCYTYANKKIGELVHRDPASLIGKNVWTEFPDAVGSATYHAFYEAMNKQHYVCNVDHYAPLQLWQENHIYPSPDGLSIFIKDISEKKRLEQELTDQQRNEQRMTIASALEAQEKERTHIGRELHDNVNQIIAATKVLLSYVNDNPEEFHDLMPKCINNLDTAIHENRKIAHELVTPDLKSGSLIDELGTLIEYMLTASGIKTTFNVSHFNEQLLNTDQKLAIYRIAQEQCTNIIKYAKAAQASFTLITLEDCFTMTITDNGLGMPQEKTTKGIGLRNIESRISIFNGSMNIQSATNSGFKLKITMPVK